jgi:hypothetical protein
MSVRNGPRTPTATYVNGATGYPYVDGRDDWEKQSLRRELRTTRTELATTRRQVTTQGPLESTPIRNTALGRVNSLPGSPRIERLIAGGGSATRAYRADIPLPRTSYAAYGEEALVAACADRDRTIQDLQTAVHRLKYVLEADGRGRVNRLVQELLDAQEVTHTLRREVVALQDRLAIAEQSQHNAAVDTAQGHKEVIDLQEALLQEKCFENDRLRSLVKELRTQVTILESSRRPSSPFMRTAPSRSGSPLRDLGFHSPSRSPLAEPYQYTRHEGEEEVNEY